MASQASIDSTIASAMPPQFKPMSDGRNSTSGMANRSTDMASAWRSRDSCSRRFRSASLIALSRRSRCWSDSSSDSLPESSMEPSSFTCLSCLCFPFFFPFLNLWFLGVFGPLSSVPHPSSTCILDKSLASSSNSFRSFSSFNLSVSFSILSISSISFFLCSGSGNLTDPLNVLTKSGNRYSRSNQRNPFRVARAFFISLSNCSMTKQSCSLASLTM
mmetsp:Transcript_718/g.1506  ORF Transcript_718/g.1506 Transcript_718/m.1506 type:complete len:217 (-) Transcript_718:910-1560(-)